MPKPVTALVVRIDSNLYQKARFLAEQDSRSFNNYLTILLQRIVADYETANGEIHLEDET